LKIQTRLPRQGRLIGIDYGEKRIGISLTDALQITAQLYETLRVASDTDAVEKLAKLCTEQSVRGIVVGLPVSMRGSEGPMAQKVREFAQNLAQATGLPVALWDERLSSLQAERTLRELNKKPSRHRAEIDRMAASFILRNYLDSRKDETT